MSTNIEACNKLDKNRPIDLISIGRVGVDLFAWRSKQHLKKVNLFRKYLGGTSGNIAVGAARLGLKVSILSRIGADYMGEFLHSVLEREGVATDYLVTDNNHITGLVLVGLHPQEHPEMIFYRENCADMQLSCADVDRVTFQNAKAILITGTGFSTKSIRNTTQYAISRAKSVGTLVVIDIDYRPALWDLPSKSLDETRFVPSPMVTRQYEKILKYCDLIVGTENEIRIASGKDEIGVAIERIRKMTNAPIVIKRGERGCEVYAPGSGLISVKAYNISVESVIGAGDAFMCGFLRGWLTKMDYTSCAKLGNANGAIVASQIGCSDAMAKSYEDLLQFMHKHQEKE